MDSLMKSLSTGIGLLIGIAIWAILFAVILEVLKKASPFESWTCYVLAACVSLLSVIGMHRMLAGRPTGAENQGGGEPFSFLLLPYAAMGISMLLVLLLLFLRKISRLRKEMPWDEERSKVTEQHEFTEGSRHE